MSQGRLDTVISLLPLWEKVARTKSATDEGSLSAETNPHPASLREATLSHKGRGCTSRRIDAAKAVPHGGRRARGEHRQDPLVLVIAVERDPLQRRHVVGALGKQHARPRRHR